jgi:hypothetical protein
MPTIRLVASSIFCSVTGPTGRISWLHQTPGPPEGGHYAIEARKSRFQQVLSSGSAKDHPHNICNFCAVTVF